MRVAFLGRSRRDSMLIEGGGIEGKISEVRGFRKSGALGVLIVLDPADCASTIFSTVCSTKRLELIGLGQKYMIRRDGDCTFSKNPPLDRTIGASRAVQLDDAGVWGFFEGCAGHDSTRSTILSRERCNPKPLMEIPSWSKSQEASPLNEPRMKSRSNHPPFLVRRFIVVRYAERKLKCV